MVKEELVKIYEQMLLTTDKFKNWPSLDAAQALVDALFDYAAQKKSSSPKATEAPSSKTTMELGVANYGGSSKAHASSANSEDSKTIPFGKHKDTPISEVPDGYLQWVQKQEWVKNSFPELLKNIEIELTERKNPSTLSSSNDSDDYVPY